MLKVKIKDEDLKTALDEFLNSAEAPAEETPVEEAPVEEVTL